MTPSTKLPATWRIPSRKTPMTRFVRFAILAALAGTVLRAESLNDILARMDQSAKNLRTFSAKMKRTEYTKVLNDKEESDGLRLVKRANNGQTIGIVQFFGKNPQTVRLAGKTVEVYYPDAKLVEVYDAGKFGKIGKQVDQLLLLGIGVTSADLRRDFEITAGGTETIDGKPTTRIQLIPKDSDLKKQAEKIEMWVPAGESVPIQVKVTRTSGDYNQAIYSDVQMNPALPDSAFELKLPADVKRKVIK
jgi:outer membrane lipoprotein-sorting protein